MEAPFVPGDFKRGRKSRQCFVTSVSCDDSALVVTVRRPFIVGITYLCCVPVFPGRRK